MCHVAEHYVVSNMKDLTAANSSFTPLPDTLIQVKLFTRCQSTELFPEKNKEPI